MTALNLGTKLQNGAFSIGKVLGQGGFGITYFGSDTRLNRLVVIKEFFPLGCTRINNKVQPHGLFDAASYAQARAKFLQEAQALAQFRHAGIVQVYTFCEENNTAYLVMEFLRGQTLSQLVEARGALPEKEAVEIIENVGAAVEELHRSKMLHRDIKPDNIIVCDDGRVVLIDFGLTKKVEEAVGSSTRQLSSTAAFGSDGFAPPEQYLKSGIVGTYTDVYALGATLYFLLTGKVPTSAIERAAGTAMVSPRSMNGVTTRATNSAVMKAIGLKAESRLQTVEDFTALLSKVNRVAVTQLPPVTISTSGTNAPQKTINNIATVAQLTTVKPAQSVLQNVELIPTSLSGTVNVHKHRGAPDTFHYPMLKDATIPNKYVAVTLHRVLVNISFKSDYTGKISRFTLFQMSFHNIWKYRMRSIGSIKLIDSEGYQHADESVNQYEFDHVVLASKRLVKAQFDSPESELEDNAKTKGWIWFKELPHNVSPHRIVIKRYLFSPGHTSGSINEEEIQELKIDGFETKEIELNF